MEWKRKPFSFRKSFLTSADLGAGSAGAAGGKRGGRSREPRSAEDGIKVTRSFIAHMNITFALYSPLQSLHVIRGGERKKETLHLKGLTFIFIYYLFLFFLMFIDLRHVSHMVKMLHWADGGSTGQHSPVDSGREIWHASTSGLIAASWCADWAFVAFNDLPIFKQCGQKTTDFSLTALFFLPGDPDGC